MGGHQPGRRRVGARRVPGAAARPLRASEPRCIQTRALRDQRDARDLQPGRRLVHADRVARTGEQGADVRTRAALPARCASGPASAAVRDHHSSADAARYGVRCAAPPRRLKPASDEQAGKQPVVGERERARDARRRRRDAELSADRVEDDAEPRVLLPRAPHRDCDAAARAQDAAISCAARADRARASAPRGRRRRRTTRPARRSARGRARACARCRGRALGAAARDRRHLGRDVRQHDFALVRHERGCFDPDVARAAGQLEHALARPRRRQLEQRPRHARAALRRRRPRAPPTRRQPRPTSGAAATEAPSRPCSR